MVVDIVKYIQSKKDNILREIALRLENEARKLVPVRTGNLKDSIKSGILEDGAWIGAGLTDEVDYATYVEYGTIHQRAQPYLRPAVFRVEKAIPSIIRRHFSNTYNK